MSQDVTHSQASMGKQRQATANTAGYMHTWLFSSLLTFEALKMILAMAKPDCVQKPLETKSP